MKLKLRSKLKPIKPVFKGFITFIIGLFITRQFVGIGRFTTNFWFGFIAYILISIAGLICIKILEVDVNSSDKRRFDKKQLQIIEICIFLGGILLTLINVFFYVLDPLIILIPVLIGVLWTFIIYYLPKKLDESDVKKIMLSTIFSLGLIYGAALNTLSIPIYVFLFFSALSFSQLSREMNRDFVVRKRKDILRYAKVNRPLDEALKYSFIFQVITIGCLIVPIFLGIAYPMLYLYLLIPTLLLIGFSAYFTYKGMNEKKNFRKINICLKWGMIFELFVILLSN